MHFCIFFFPLQYALLLQQLKRTGVTNSTPIQEASEISGFCCKTLIKLYYREIKLGGQQKLHKNVCGSNGIPTNNLFKKRYGALEKKKEKNTKTPKPPAAHIILCTLVFVKQNGQQ